MLACPTAPAARIGGRGLRVRKAAALSAQGLLRFRIQPAPTRIQSAAAARIQRYSWATQTRFPVDKPDPASIRAPHPRTVRSGEQESRPTRLVLPSALRTRR